jgi:hypothetical protein
MVKRLSEMGYRLSAYRLIEVEAEVEVENLKGEEVKR